ncbi:MAG TPA: FecR domain-containing protein [Polyangia bacterium]|nr:FecR domain-containing protein [Polyangia bacterium]
MKARERDARVEAEVAAPLREVSPALDELHRARLASAIEAALDREDEAVVAARSSGGRGRWRVWASLGGIAAAALGAVVLLRAPHTQTRPRAGVAVAPPGARGAPALLVPVTPAIEGAPTLAPSTSLLALAGERTRATVGARVRLTLVGPGRVSVLAPPRAGDIELVLDGGRLLVDYDGHAGGTLRVRSPGAVTTVVGTLFAVEVAASGSRVAVARGRVRTENAAGQVWHVAAGDSWTSDQGRLSPISDELAAALVRHEAAWTAPSAAPAEPEVAPPAPAARPPAAAGAPAGRAARPLDLEALYAQAEAAMRARAVGEARRTLETIADHDGRGPLGEAALLDLARLALGEGDQAEARRALGRLPRRLADPALAETAAHLRCRAERGPDDGDRCGP